MSRQQKAAPVVKTFRDYGIEVNTLVEDQGEVVEFQNHIAGLDKDDSALIIQMQEQLEIKKEEAARVLIRAICPMCQAYKLQVDRKKESWACDGCDWPGSLRHSDGSKGLLRINEVAPELERWHVQGPPKGASTGWDNIDKLYTPRRGELSLITGIPGHGKTTWLLSMAVNIAVKEGWRFAVFSPENKPAAVLLLQLVLKVVGKSFNEMSQAELRLASEWVGQHFVIIDPFEATPANIMAQATKAVKERGVQGVIIDPWTEVDCLIPEGLREDQYLKIILGKLKNWSRQAHVHLWIVVHPKNMAKETDSKSKKRYPVPTPYDLNGGSQWYNKADWCLCVYRVVQAKQDYDAEDGQTQIYVQKVRFGFLGGGTGMERLHYHEPTASYYVDGDSTLSHPWPILGIMEQLKKGGHKFEEGWTWPPKDGLALRPIIWNKDGAGYLHMGEKHEATVQPVDDQWHAKIWLIARKGDPFSEREQYSETLDGAFDAAERQLMDWDYLPPVVR